MRIVYTSIPAIDGFPLASTIYEPHEEKRSDKTVLINSAIAVKRTYYETYAKFLMKEGFTVITFDYRGIGDSRPHTLKSFKAFMHEWGKKDVAGVIQWVSEHYGSEKLLIVGHSAGGQLVGLATNNKKITAMLAVAVQSGYWRLWDPPRKYLMAVLWYVLMPTLTKIFSYFPAKRLRMGEDLPAGVALEWTRWCRNPSYIVDEDGNPMRENFNTFSAPILAYSFEDDIYAPKRAVEALMKCYATSYKKIVHKHIFPKDLGVSYIGHFGFFREIFRSTLWRESTNWLKQQ